METEYISSEKISALGNREEKENISNGDVSLDLLEQKQAQEQARLLQRFRELRQWQLKQQEQLMKQQQQQLEGLRKEQMKVQTMLTKQRESQWGAGRVTRQSLSPTRTPPRRQINQRELLASVLKMDSGMSESEEPVSCTAVPSSSLPQPIIYAEPKYDDNDAATNPELFSNPDSNGRSQDIEVDLRSDDGMFPLQETDSDQSEHYRNVFSIRDSVSEFSVGTENEYPPPRTSLSTNHHQSMEFLRSLTADDLNSIESVASLQQMLQTTTPNTLRRMLGILPQNLPSSQTVSEQLRGNPESCVGRNTNCFQESRSPVNQCVREDEFSSNHDTIEDEEESQNITVKENEHTEPQFDDRPIKPGIVGKKTFEQLLEEEMLAEEEKLKNAEKSPSQSKKPFLRKGEGLSRFKKPPVRTKVKTENKRKSAETGINTDNQKKISEQSAPKDFSSKQKQKKEVKIADSKSLKQPSQKPLKPPNKTTTMRHPELDKKPTKNTISPPNELTQSTPLKADTETNIRKEIQEDSVSETATDTDEPSFCIKGKRKEKVEKQELEMFELFEDFADNVSFCSNSSVVVKLLEKDRQKQQGDNVSVEEIKGIIEEKMAQKQKEVKDSNKTVSEELPVLQKADNVDDISDSDSSLDSTLTDSDSSLATDSGQEDPQDRIDDQDYSVSDISQNNNMKSGIIFTRPATQVDADNKMCVSMPLSPSKSITRKIASKDISNGTSVDTLSLLKKLSQNSGTCAGATKENHESENVRPKPVHSAIEKVKVNNVGDSRKEFVSTAYQNGRENSDDDSVESDDAKEQDTSLHQMNRNANANNDDDDDDDGDEEEDEEEDEFGDTEEWTDTAPKVHSGRDSGIDSIEQGSNTSNTPPTSRLVSRLFPKLKEAQQVKQQQKKQQEQEKLQSAANAGLGEGIQSKVLREKLMELEMEIEKFREENAALDKLHRDREEGLNKLKKEIGDFEKEKAEELRRLEEFKTQEMKKIRHERKMFIKYQKTIRSMPDKKDREEIEMLKTQLSELQEELKRKEARWNATNSRLRDKLAQSELENKELREEIKLLEKRRLESMQKENGYKKINGHSLPRSSTPTEDINLTRNYQGMREPPKAISPSTLTQPQPAVNSHAPVAASLSISTSKPHPSLSVSVDAVPRGNPAAAATLHSIPEMKDNGFPTSVNNSIPRKQSAKFISQNPGIDKGDCQFEELLNPDGRIERTYTNGAREILFSNGTRKEISSDGQSIVVSFFNGDIKQIFPDQRVVYFFADAQTTHTTYPDGLEILQFQNDQIEKHYPDGTKEITFPDQTIKYLFPNGSEESIFPDGTVIRVESNGDKTMEFPNGQREIHTEQFKKREYPDGTVKTVYPDGRQETRYSTGRIRLKDKDGNVIMDRVC